jgi:hypothetical protein
LHEENQTMADDPFEGTLYRKLNTAETDLARSVFGSSLPYDRIRITRVANFGNRAFVTPGYMVATVAWLNGLVNPLMWIPGVNLAALGFAGAATIAQIWMADKYLVCMGENYYLIGLIAPPTPPYTDTRVLLCHELTHVWQGHHGATSWDYIVNALGAQCSLGDAAYDISGGDGVVTAGEMRPFHTYNAEQQGVLVESYLADRLAGRHPNVFEPYIRDNIRPGKPQAITGELRQSLWWQCSKCTALVRFNALNTARPGRPPAFAPLPTPRCPTDNGVHIPSGNECSVMVTPPESPAPGTWKQCTLCRCLVRLDSAQPSQCCVNGGAHTPSTSSILGVSGMTDFFLQTAGDTRWRACKKCAALFNPSGGGASKRCAQTGAAHEKGAAAFAL